MWRQFFSRRSPSGNEDNKQKQHYGKIAEDIASGFLIKQGLALITRNYRCARGEIDLIMRDDIYVVFVEVRYRKNNKFGSGAETVDFRKQRKLASAAAHYLQRIPALAKLPCRFDVISISPGNNAPQIQWIKDAFQPSPM